MTLRDKCVTSHALSAVSRKVEGAAHASQLEVAIHKRREFRVASSTTRDVVIEMAAFPVPRLLGYGLASAAYRARVAPRRAITLVIVHNNNRTAATATATATAATTRCRAASVSSLRVVRRDPSISTAAAASSSSTSTTQDVNAVTETTTETSDDDAVSYLDSAARPSRFEESSWGPEDVRDVLLQAMRIQWSHGYPHTPRGYPRLTHGFHEYPAGMQAAAADRILDVLPGDSLMDPFMGSGCSLVVGMTKGRATYGIDVSPLATFVAAHRTWRPERLNETLDVMQRAADAATERKALNDAVEALNEEFKAGKDAAAVAVATAGENENEDEDASARRGEDRGDRRGGGGAAGAGGGGGGGAVPRDWRPVQRALANHIATSPDFRAREREDSDGGAEEGVAGALWFCLSVALQRSQKGRGKKRRPYKKQRNKKAAAAAAGATTGSASDSQVEAAASFAKVVEEYAARVSELSNAVPSGTPRAVVYNRDIRSMMKLDEPVDAVLTSPPYPGVYDYLSFARKVRAGSGTATAVGEVGEDVGQGEGEGGVGHQTSTAAVVSTAIIPGSDAYFHTDVPSDRSWPSQWTEGEIGARKSLRSDPYAFKETWQREQEGWLGVVAASLKTGGRAAVMVGDGANIKTQESILEAGKTVGLRGIAGVTMALTHNMEDGRVWNAARKEHLILLEKESKPDDDSAAAM